ncbi:SIR2 family protein [Sphingomonas sp. 179-A 2A2 NHS]|uniref:SIR2 family protein n=1 Tax=Sphingomonas sp. 179-A 2A2 NHS TaxID=3374290 RepID=UPI00387A6070
MPTRPQTGPRPREISELVQDLQRARGHPRRADDGGSGGDVERHRGRAVFLIGAGCSASAGIPLAAGVAEQAIVRIADDYGIERDGRGGHEALVALIAANRVPERYGPVDGVVPWGRLYSYIFTEHMKHPNEQRELISRLVEDKEYTLNWAHACLGALVEKRFVHTILTTNFDQLALQGVIRTGIVPVVADGLESLNRISPTPSRPQVVHLHGSMHTYELRNSYAALRETEDDRGLQVMMMSLLKEASVLVIVGYAGGEEGVMTLLQYAAKALPRMVVYWIAYEDDLDLLSERAKALLTTGENKFFILGQKADDFFNQVVGEAGIGAPDWLSDPLGVLERQADISIDASAGPDVRRLQEAYKARVAHAVQNGRLDRTSTDDATEFRSALQFRKAAEAIEAHDDFLADDDLLAIHADSLFNHYKRKRSDHEALATAINELRVLVERTGVERTADVITYIEALREQSDALGEDATELAEVFSLIEGLATRVRDGLAAHAQQREWSQMTFYLAEAVQSQAEQERRGDDDAVGETKKKRKARLEEARQFYAAALPGLSSKDANKAKECKEGLAGALIALAEYEGEGVQAASRLREAQTLFREVVQWTGMNTPGEQHAGALENLAEAIRSMRAKFNDEAHGSRIEEAQLFETALSIYEALDDEDSAGRIRNRLHCEA